jgi:prepilin-type N-terminal cleavage/methylation domain-containing protein
MFKKTRLFDEEKNGRQFGVCKGNAKGVSCSASESGFTLIEVLIALVILGIALIPLLVAQARAVGDYGYANNAAFETVLARNIMSNIFLLNDIYIMNKHEKIRGAKGYIAKESISKTSYPGIYMIKITVFKKGRNPKNGITLKSLAQ